MTVFCVWSLYLTPEWQDNWNVTKFGLQGSCTTIPFCDCCWVKATCQTYKHTDIERDKSKNNGYDPKVLFRWTFTTYNLDVIMFIEQTINCTAVKDKCKCKKRSEGRKVHSSSQPLSSLFCSSSGKQSIFAPILVVVTLVNCDSIDCVPHGGW